MILQAEAWMGNDGVSLSKTYIVDTSILLGAPGCLARLAPGNKVVVPHPVLSELDGKRTNTNGVGHTARTTIRLVDEVQRGAPIEQMNSGIPFNGGLLAFHGGEIDMSKAWPGINTSYADDLIILFSREYQRDHPEEKVVLLTRDGAMRCRARAQQVAAEDFESDSPVASPSEIYTGKEKIVLPSSSAGLLTDFSRDRRITLATLEDQVGVLPELFPNICCELRVEDSERSVWGILRTEGGTQYLRKVSPPKEQAIGPKNMEQACALELIVDPTVPIVSLLSIAGTGKTLIALLGAYRLLQTKQASRIEVYRVNAEAGKELGFLPGGLDEKMAPWTRPIIDNMEFILAKLHPQSFPGPIEERQGKDKGRRNVNLESMLQSGELVVSPINFLRGRSIHNTIIIVDDGQNLTQEDMKLVLTRVGEGSQVILTGDPDQTDRSEVNRTANGLVRTVTQFRGQPEFGHLTFTQVLRSRVSELAATLL